MSCPPNSMYGFVNLTTVPTSSEITTATQGTNTSPFRINFAPRSTPLSLLDKSNRILEDFQNTLEHKGTTYTIASVQICKPSLGSYSIYGSATPSEATIIYTYMSQAISGAVGAYRSAVEQKQVPLLQSQLPLLILMIVPIYLGNASSANASYLTQFISTSTTTNKYTSMQQLFTKQPSFGYSACFDTQLIPEAPTFGIMTNIYTFPRGITLSNADWNAISKSLPSPIPPFNFENVQIIQSYNADGTPNLANPSSSLAIQQINTSGDNKFMNRIIYYTLDVGSSPTKAPSLLTPDQYQCVPFDQLKNLTTDPGGVKKVSLQSVINVENSTGKIGTMLSWDQIWIFVTTIGVAIGIFILFGLLMWGIAIAGREEVTPEILKAAGLPSATPGPGTGPATPASAPASAPAAP